MKLNKLGYQQLIDEDIEWLKTITRTLERDHIIAVLEASVEHEYPSNYVAASIANYLPTNEDDEQIVDELIAKKTASMKTQPLKGKE